MSVAAQLHDHYRDVRKRLMGKPPSRKPPELTIVRLVMTEEQKRVWKRKLAASNDNPAWVIMSKIFPAECDLIRRTCAGTGVTIKDIISDDQTHRVVPIRDKCVEAIHIAYPDMNSSDIGMLLQRDRSTIHAAFDRLGIQYVNTRRSNFTQAQVDEIKRFKNMTYAEIGKLYGVSHNVIQNVRNGRYNPKQPSPHTEG